MEIFERKRKSNKLGWSREIVFDTPEEAAQYGVVAKEFPETGEWFKYGDGKVARILHSTQVNKTVIYRTILNDMIYRHAGRGGKVGWRGVKYGVFLKRRAVFNDELDLEHITPRHEKFAKMWLFEGKTIEEAVKECFKDMIPRAHHHVKNSKCPNGVITYSGNKSFSDYRNFGYIILSGIWFDKLLKHNRVYRERYMNLVGALEMAGVTKDFVAEQIKVHILSEDAKKSVPALKLAVDVMAAEEIKAKSKIPVNPAGLYQLMENGVKQIAEYNEIGLVGLKFDTEHEVLPVEATKEEKDNLLRTILEEDGILNPHIQGAPNV